MSAGAVAELPPGAHAASGGGGGGAMPVAPNAQGGAGAGAAAPPPPRGAHRSSAAAIALPVTPARATAQGAQRGGAMAMTPGATRGSVSVSASARSHCSGAGAAAQGVTQVDATAAVQATCSDDASVPATKGEEEIDLRTTKLGSLLSQALHSMARRGDIDMVQEAGNVTWIFRVLGHPGIKAWPELEVLPHWVDNTDNVRVRRPEWGGTGLHTAVLDAMRAAAPSWAQGHVPQECVPPREAIDLMSRMLDYNPTTRATAEEALRHEWFRTDPKPGPNVFRTPGASAPLVRYPRRPMTLDRVPHGAGGGAGAGPAGGEQGLPGPPAPPRGPGGSVGGMSRGSSQAAAMLAAQQGPQGKRRRMENVPGFR